MTEIKKRIAACPWNEIRTDLYGKGFAVVKNVLPAELCSRLAADFDSDALYRKTVHMERHRFGSGLYRYFGYPLPEVITELREAVYPELVPVANRWMEELRLPERFPLLHQEMKRRCGEAGQVHPTVLILKYGPGGFNTLHQDLYGEVYFPMQAVFMLDQVGKAYTGGELVLTEQFPRAQSKATVLRPDCGDMVVLTTSFRPVEGTKGYYRVRMKHGVSPVLTGTRHSLGVIFHDAAG